MTTDRPASTWCTLREIGINFLGLPCIVYAFGAVGWALLDHPRRLIDSDPEVAFGHLWLYVAAVLIYAAWIPVSAALAESSLGDGLTNLWRDSFVPVGVASLLIACILVQEDDGRIRNMAIYPFYWGLSLFAGLTVSLLNLLDTLYHATKEEKIDKEKTFCWKVLNWIVLIPYGAAFFGFLICLACGQEWISELQWWVGYAAPGIVALCVFFAVGYSGWLHSKKSEQPAESSNP